MGASQSAAQSSQKSDAEPEPPAPSPPPATPPPPPPPSAPPAASLLAQPDEVLVHICDSVCGGTPRLSTENGRTLAAYRAATFASQLLCTCSELRERAHALDDIFAPVLKNRVCQLIPKLEAQRRRRVPPSDEDIYLLDELLPDLRRRCEGRADAATRGCRAGLNELHQHLCALCHAHGNSGLNFPLTRRGICLVCVAERTAHAEHWRRRQRTLEAVAQQSVDAVSRRAILHAVRDALPLELQPGGGTRRPRRAASSGAASSGGAGEEAGAEGRAAAADGSADPRGYHIPSADPELQLVFDAQRHGGSTVALCRQAMASPARGFVLVIAERPTPLASAPAPRTPRSFGAFVSTRWERGPANHFGDERGFLFSLPPPPSSTPEPAEGGAEGGGDGGGHGDGGPARSGTATIHRATGFDRCFVHASGEHGIAFGGPPMGLSLEADLTRGRCLPSLTYGDTSRLASSTDFLCENVQLWAVYASADEARSMRRLDGSAPWEGEVESSLEPGENKLLLEFVGMDREVAMLRRFT